MRDEDEERKRRGFLAFLAMVVLVALQLIVIQAFAGPESGSSDVEVSETELPFGDDTTDESSSATSTEPEAGDVEALAPVALSTTDSVVGIDNVLVEDEAPRDLAPRDLAPEAEPVAQVEASTTSIAAPSDVPTTVAPPTSTINATEATISFAVSETANAPQSTTTAAPTTAPTTTEAPTTTAAPSTRPQPTVAPTTTAAPTTAATVPQPVSTKPNADIE